jgi:ABC-type transport system involved in Fe-S cluster assembly fused permease/ATPase subunit
MYGLLKFSADAVGYMRELPFAHVSGAAEVYIAGLVYHHTQRQSLAFHLSRETGKIIRIVSRGSQSFASILRYAVIMIWPTLLEIILVLGIILYLYPVEFFANACIFVVLYFVATIYLTERRAGDFKRFA